ncbi:MAG TPA: helix-turn-helix domain-containing protein [Flavobacterium sp.]|nr:helix-turn-helix domain-containing protein [Flavobacterium sp.]
MSYFSVMETWVMFVDFVLIAGISLLALNIFFLAKSKGGISRKILIVFFANAIFFLLYYYGYLHRSRIVGGIGILFGHGMGFLLGPMLLFLLKSLVLKKERYLRSLYIQLIPFGLVWLFFSVPLFISMATPYLRSFNEWYVDHEYLVNIPENIFFMVYIMLSLRLLSRIRYATRENSATDKNDLNWYRHLLIGFAIIVVFDTLCTIYELFFPMIPWNIGTLIAFSLIAMYIYLGYKGMFQAQILIPEFLLQKMSIASVPEEPEQQSAQKMTARALDSYSAEEIDILKKKLSYALAEKKVYLDDSLTLADLADELGITTKKLSELINQHLDTNFYNLINDYRVNEVIARLSGPDAEKFTLLGIAFDCGFQSKASFNRIFKQKTGQSPSAYKKQLISDVEFTDE